MWPRLGDVFVQNDGVLSIAPDVLIRSTPVRSHLVIARGAQLVIEGGVRISHGAAISAHASIHIGEGTILEPFVTIIDADFHRVGDLASSGTPRPIHIGRNVRIGAGSIILRGATIGDGARIRPQSVVSRRVPEGAVVEGSPAKPVKAATPATLTTS